VVCRSRPRADHGILGEPLDEWGQTPGLPLPQQLNGTQCCWESALADSLHQRRQLNVQVPYTVPVNTQYQ